MGLTRNGICFPAFKPSGAVISVRLPAYRAVADRPCRQTLAKILGTDVAFPAGRIVSVTERRRAGADDHAARSQLWLSACCPRSGRWCYLVTTLVRRLPNRLCEQ